MMNRGANVAGNEMKEARKRICHMGFPRGRWTSIFPRLRIGLARGPACSHQKKLLMLRVFEKTHKSDNAS